MNKDIRWIYKSSIGELEIWAKDIREVEKTLKEHGFFKVDLSKISKSPINAEHEEVR